MTVNCIWIVTIVTLMGLLLYFVNNNFINFILWKWLLQSDSRNITSVIIVLHCFWLLLFVMYKVVNNIAPTIVSELFSFWNVNYNLRSGSQLHQPFANTVWNGQKTISYLGQKSEIWCQRNAFKREIKQWVPNNCPRRICKNYLPNIGFI